jgi:hypothetical protein
MRTAGIRRWDGETVLVAALAATVSVVAFLLYFRRGEILLYGDAVAHINIARRVFDSRTPGLLQLGTVWLPLPHLLMLPFLLSDWAWRTGVGGSIPSMVAFVLGAIGIFRLVRGALSFYSAPETAARLTAWVAAVIFLANPNLIYLQATAMTEPLYLAWFIWATVYFAEYAKQAGMADEVVQGEPSLSLTKCGLCLLGACLTRYDGWLLAAAMGAAVLAVNPNASRARNGMRGVVRRFALLVAVGPIFWLAYNSIIYRNPLEFANGPYSASAIEQKQTGNLLHPGADNLSVAASYFLKSAQLNLAEGNWRKLWLTLLIAGTVMAILFDRRLWPLLMLWVPLPFYMLSVAYSGVPIYVPTWWPFSYYNVRYGIELLPAFAVFVALVGYFAAGFARNNVIKAAIGVAVAALIAGSYVSVWRVTPVCFTEATINSRSRIALESQLAAKIRDLPPESTILMYLGDHVGALQQAGIPLRRVICEGNHRTWKHPADPEGLWEQALANPEQHADFVIAMDGDPVASAIRGRGLSPLAEVLVPGQPRATIYPIRPSTR